MQQSQAPEEIRDYPAIIRYREHQFELRMIRHKFFGRGGKRYQKEFTLYDQDCLIPPRSLDLIWVKEVLEQVKKVCGDRTNYFLEKCQCTDYTKNEPERLTNAERGFVFRIRAKLRAWAKEQEGL